MNNRLIYITGLFLLVSAVFMQSFSLVSAATTNYSLTWAVDSYIGLRIITGTPGVPGPANVSREVCLGVSKWTVTGNSGTTSITETWDGTTNIKTTGSVAGNLNPAQITNGEGQIFFTNNPQYRTLYRTSYGGMDVNQYYYGYRNNLPVADCVSFDNLFESGRPANQTRGDLGGVGPVTYINASGRRIGEYAMELWSSDPDRPWEEARFFVGPQKWVVSGTVTTP